MNTDNIINVLRNKLQSESKLQAIEKEQIVIKNINENIKNPDN